MRYCHFISGLLVLLSLSCSKHFNEEAASCNSEPSVRPPLRTVQEASRLAEIAATDFLGENTKISAPSLVRTVDHEHLYSFSPKKTKSSDNSPLFYIVNYADSCGFSIIAANRSLPPIWVVAESGRYDGSLTPNECFNLCIESLTTGMQEMALLSNDDIINETYKTEKSTSSGSVGPMTSAAWHQRLPFNRYCSSPFDSEVPAGCGAIAVGTALSALKYPTTIELKYNGATRNKLDIDWDRQIPHNNWCGDDCELCRANADLIRELGDRLNMKYGKGGSSCNFSDIRKVLLRLGLSADKIADYKFYDVRKSIEAGHPVILRGVNSDNEGHFWVVDGLKVESERVNHYKKNLNIPNSSWELYSYAITDNWYLHFNYGWKETYGYNSYFLPFVHHKDKGPMFLNGGEEYDTVTMFTGVPTDKEISTINNIYRK